MKARRTGLLRKALAVLVAIPLLGMAGIAADGLTDDVRPSDVAIVLGNTVSADGTPSPWLKARLDRAIELYRQGSAANIIVSGGPVESGGEEATAMRAYLVANGLPEGRVIPDFKGVNTMATGRNGAAIMQARGWESAIVVSQFYHITRARLALQAYDVRPVYGAHARRFFWRDAYALGRELVANVNYRSRLWRHGPPR